MNALVPNVRAIEVPLPTDGSIALASDNAAQIMHDCDMAVRCQSWGGHIKYVQNAREQLSELARRLGYELVPARGGIDG